MPTYENHSQPDPEPEDGKMSKPRTIMETAATVLVTAAAVVVASAYVYGQFADGPDSRD